MLLDKNFHTRGIKLQFTLSKKKTILKKGFLESADDLELIEKAIDGNMSAFSTIVQRYESMIAKITISMIGNKDDADDIGQEVFIRFYRSMGSFKGDSKLGTYLARVAINLSLNEIKKRSKKWLTLTSNYDENELSSGENNDSDDIKNIINISLAKLEPEFRSVVVLRHIQGFSTKETSDILKIPQGTVLSRLARGQKKLKEIITKLEII